MKLKGYLTRISEPRTWTTQQGETRYSYPVEISVPYLTSQGEERHDELMGEHVAGNPEYVNKLAEAMQQHAKMEFTCGFSIREWNGKRIGNMKISNIQMLME